MNGLTENSEFCFPWTLNVCQWEILCKKFGTNHRRPGFLLAFTQSDFSLLERFMEWKYDCFNSSDVRNVVQIAM